MLAGARRNGLLAYVLAPELKDVLAEVAAGNPVVVLQNLGLWAFHPYWHYAVVIGYDLEKNQILLHSGAKARRVMTLGLFEFLWIDGGRWAMVALAPDACRRARAKRATPPRPRPWNKAAASREAHRAYAALVQRWPANLVGWMGLGNTAYTLGRTARCGSGLPPGDARCVLRRRPRSTTLRRHWRTRASSTRRWMPRARR